MADSIVITFDGVDNTGAATGTAVSNITKLGQAVQKVGGSSPDSVMNKWTKSQYAAAEAGSLLTDKAISLSNAINAGKMTTEQARKEYSAFEGQMKRNVWQTMTVGEKYQVVSQKLQNMQAGMLKIGIASAGVFAAGKALYNFAESGAELEFTRTKFDRLAQSAGTVGNVFMSQLRVATKGTVSDMQLAKNASDLFQLGLAGSSEEAIRLSKVQTALGMDTGELTLALANQSKRRLDQLGLSLTKFNEIEARLRDAGMSKEAAFKEAFLQTAEQTVVTTGNQADSNYGNFLRLKASGANLLDAAKLKAPNMGLGWMFGGDTVSQTANKVSMFMNGISNLMSGNTVFDMSGGLGAPSWVRRAGLQDKSALWDRSKQNQFGPVTARNGAVAGLSALQNYTAMAYKYGSAAQGGLGAVPPEAQATVDYAKLLSGSLAMTKQNQSYLNSVQKIHEQYSDKQYVREQFRNDVQKLREELAKTGDYQKYYEETGKLSAAFKDGSFAAQKEAEQVGELNKQMEQSAAAFALNLMSQDEAFDPEKAYDFAAATGQITQKAADQYKAFSKVKDALAGNTLNAQQAALAVKNVSGDVKALNGMTVSTYIDVYIRTHGSMIDFGTVGAGSEDTKRRGGGIGFASGTTNVGRAGIYDVGEMGYEKMVIRPDGSVAIIPHELARKMDSFGIGADAGFAVGTGDAGGGGGLAPSGYKYLKSRIRPAITSRRTASEETQVVQTQVDTMQTTVKGLNDAVDRMSKAFANSKTELGEHSIRRIGEEVGLQFKKVRG